MGLDDELIGLRVAPAGLAALGIEPEEATEGLTPSASEVICAATMPILAEQSDTHDESKLNSIPDIGRSHDSEVECESSKCSVLPRRGTKQALLIAMLQREEGASIEAIMTATGWLPHSSRAALTGLRKAGHHLVKSNDDTGRTIYRLADPAAAGAPVGEVGEASE